MNFLISLLCLFVPFVSEAHVKWFATNTHAQNPQSFSEFNTPQFWMLLLLSMFTIGLLVYLDKKLEHWKPYQSLNHYLSQKTNQATIVLRVFTGASLLLAWQTDTMIAPELQTLSSSVGWFEFVLVLLLLTSFTTPLAGLGMIGLFFYAMNHYGVFHLLDYVIYPAIGYFLFVSSFRNPKINNTRIPALYLGLGFSLCWVAMEKFFFPQWGLDILNQKPALTMGLEHSFFLMASAFVEVCLGYLLIIGLLQRPLALVITFVFFTTTTFFGKTEVIGHTLLHGALIVFIIVGPGRYYPAPITFHEKLPLRILFAVVNFVILSGVLAFAYHAMAGN